MSGETEPATAFDRVFNAAARARQELTARTADDLLSSTRRLFRRQVHRVQGRRTNPVWEVKLFLLPGPNIEVLPARTELLQLTRNGLGSPAHESVAQTKSKIELNWSLLQLNNFICQSYSCISLNLVGFELARAGKTRKIQRVQAASVRELKQAVGKSRLYVVPRADVLQSLPEVIPPSSTMLSPLPSTAAMLNETSSMAENTQSQNSVALQEWRALRTQQDQEYNESLLLDKEKEMRRLAYEASEERRKKTIKSRRQRMAGRNEPSDGIPFKFKYPDGSITMGKFLPSESIEVLFDFAGQEDMASEAFSIQEATSSVPIESSATGSIAEYGMKASSMLYVLWISNLDVMPQSTLNSTETVDHTLSFDPLVPQSSTEQLMPPLSIPPSIQSSPSLPSFDAPVMVNADQQNQSYSSVQEPIVILEDQEDPLSPHHWSQVSSPPTSEPASDDMFPLHTILENLVSKVDFTHCPTSNQINVCRDMIMQGTLQAFKRRRFNPEAKLDIVFVDGDQNGEGAIDDGGPTREFLRLLMRAIHQCNIFEGHEKDRCLALNTQALESKLYIWVGKMIAVCVVHGGVGPHFFSERLFHQLCGIPTSPALVDEVGDHTFREQLIKIQDATTVQEANSAITEAADSLSMIGALRYISKLEEKDSLVQSAAEFFVNGRMQVALDQFKDGLRTLGLLEALQTNSAVFYNMFVSEEKPLQAKELCTLFEVDFSMQGSNNRAKENQTICFWRDWLIDIQEGEAGPITLEMVLEFASGASAVPPLGFPHRPLIQFLHEADKIFPEANTCIIVLRLPIHNEYEIFKKFMTEGILQAPTFGVA